MLQDLSDTTKHVLDFVAFMGVTLASALTLSNVALFMSLLAAICSVLWFAVRIHDRVKYGPDIND